VVPLAAAGGAALLTLPDHLVDDRFERIDSQSRWAGLALLDGAMLRKTVAMLDDWDLQSTLLRHAVQSGARQFALRREAADPRLVIAEGPDDLAELEALIVEAAHQPRGSWISRFALAPVEQMLTRVLMPSALTPPWLYIGAIVLTALAAVLFASEWLGAGMLLLLLATPLDGTAARLAAVRMQRPEPPEWWGYTQPLAAGIALAALSYTLVERAGWGCAALAATTVAFLAALRMETARHRIRSDIWLAEPKGMAWLMLPFALVGAWATGLAALASYAAGSFFWAQRQVHRRSGAAKQD
jgi:hypothetical protein